MKSTIESLVAELQRLRLEAEHIRERESHVLAQLICAGRREENVAVLNEPWYAGQKVRFLTPPATRSASDSDCLATVTAVTLKRIYICTASGVDTWRLRKNLVAV